MDDLRESFYQTFTDDPANWAKWIVVLIVFVLGYVIAVPLYGKARCRLSWKRKRDIAKSRGHVIRAELIDRYPTGEPAEYHWYASYQYTADGKEKRYKAYFHTAPPRVLYLYYLNSPKRLFSVNEYHYGNHKAPVLLPIILLPWALAVLAVFVLRIEIPGL